jgi:hypothetical protein
MEDWNIQIRQNACAQCQIPFVEKAPCHTILSTTAEGYQRQDLCVACWESSGGAMIREKAGVISYWQGVYEPPAPPPVDPLPKEDAESLLRRMLERNNPSEVEARYILAVMLERKRILKHRETRAETGKLLVYEHSKTGEVFIVTDPELKLSQLEEVQKRVALMLKPETQPSVQN